MLDRRADTLLKTRSQYNKLAFKEPAATLAKVGSAVETKKAIVPNNFKLDELDVHSERVRNELICEDIGTVPDHVSFRLPILFVFHYQ